MKGVSEVVSTIIVSSTIIIISLIIFYYAIYNVQSSINSAEFGYMESVFYNLALSVPDIIEGGSFGANVPSRIVGIGYSKLSDTSIRILIKNGTLTLLDYNSNPIALEATAHAPLVTENKTLFGCNCFIVDDVGLLPNVQVQYYKGATHLKLDLARIYIKIYVLREDSITKYIINILYLEMNPKILSSHPRRLVVYSSKDIITRSYSNIDYIEIKYSRNGITNIVNLSDLIPNLTTDDIVDVNIVVKEVNLVIT